MSFPLAADNLALSANFMRFYSQHGVSGMKILYQATGSEIKAFEFLKQVLSKKPDNAKKIIATKLKNNTIKSDDLTTIEQWLSFLYPKQRQDIYLFLHQRMLKTVSWFKQGNIDLKSGETIGLPFFLGFNNLQEDFSQIKNKEIKVNKRKGIINTYSGGISHFLSHILIYDNGKSRIIRFPNVQYSANNFVFEWNKNLGYGAVMSKAMSNTTFNKLFMRHKNQIILNLYQHPHQIIKYGGWQAMLIDIFLNHKLFVKYLIFGAIAVLIDYGAIFISYTLFEINYIISILCGFLFGSIFQFFSHFFYTFNLSKNNILFKRMLAFFLFTVIGITIGTLSIIYFEKFFHSLYL